MCPAAKLLESINIIITTRRSPRKIVIIYYIAPNVVGHYKQIYLVFYFYSFLYFC